MTQEPTTDDTTRQRIHDLADSVQAVMVKTAVIEERQSSVKAQLDRIEAAVTPLPERVGRLEERSQEARDTAVKWGAGFGAFVAACISGIAAIFGGGK